MFSIRRCLRNSDGCSANAVQVVHRRSLSTRGFRGSPRPHARRQLTTPPQAAVDVLEKLADSDVEAWNESKEIIEALGFNDEEADSVMQRSFGWDKASQSFWRGSLVEQVPSSNQVQKVIEFLAEIGIKGNDLVKYVNKFPYVFGCDVEDLLQANVNELEKTWKIKGATLTATLKRRPEILGYNLDCYGDCKGECNRCWVRF